MKKKFLVEIFDSLGFKKIRLFLFSKNDTIYKIERFKYENNQN